MKKIKEQKYSSCEKKLSTYYKCISIHNKNTLKCEKLFNSWIKCISNISLKID